MMKCSNISNEKISRKILKNDCIAVYEAGIKVELYFKNGKKDLLNHIYMEVPELEDKIHYAS